MSERALYDIVNMRGFKFLNDLYMTLLKWVSLWMLFIWYYWNGSWMCWNALYKILLKWELICAWMQFVWYKQNESLYVSEYDLYFIIKMRAGMCLSSLYIILFKLNQVCVWMLFIWYYKMWAGMCQNELYMI